MIGQFSHIIFLRLQLRFRYCRMGLRGTKVMRSWNNIALLQSHESTLSLFNCYCCLWLILRISRVKETRTHEDPRISPTIRVITRCLNYIVLSFVIMPHRTPLRVPRYTYSSLSRFDVIGANASVPGVFWSLRGTAPVSSVIPMRSYGALPGW